MATRHPLASAATDAAIDAYSWKAKCAHRAPVVIHVPLGSYLRFAAVVIVLGVALMNILPNPAVI